MANRLKFLRSGFILASYLLLLFLFFSHRLELSLAFKITRSILPIYLLFILGLELLYWILRGLIFTEIVKVFGGSLGVDEGIRWQLILLTPHKFNLLLEKSSEALKALFRRSIVSEKSLRLGNYLLRSLSLIVNLFYLLSSLFFLIILPSQFGEPFLSFAAILLIILGFLLLVSANLTALSREADRLVIGLIARFPKLRFLAETKKLLEEFMAIVRRQDLKDLGVFTLTISFLTPLRVVLLAVILLAFGKAISIFALFLVYLAARFLANILFVFPSGVGAVELFLSLGLILFGVSASTAVIAALTFRFISFYLPLSIGSLAYFWIKLSWVLDPREQK